MNRRQALMGGANFVLIGCLTVDNGQNEPSRTTESPSLKPDLDMVNLRQSAVTVNVTVDSFEQTVTLSRKDSDGAGVSYEDIPEMVQGAIVHVSIQDGPTGTYQLERDMNDYRGLTVILSPTEIRFVGGEPDSEDE